MLYYSKKPVDMDEADLTQVQKLKDFKKSIRDKGIQEQYSTIEELNQKLMRQLTIVMRGISVGTHVNANVVKEAKEDRPVEVKKPSKAAKPQKAESIQLIDYTEKSFVAVGDTTEFKDELHAINGKWMKMKSGKYGWMFSKKRLEEVAEILGIRSKLQALDE